MTSNAASLAHPGGNVTGLVLSPLSADLGSKRLDLLRQIVPGLSRVAILRDDASGGVDKILRGARPGDLPLEQPTTFDLIVNLRTAQALGLTFPHSVLQQATEILQ